MCGICGKLNFERDTRVDPVLVRGMLDRIRHRGPDDEGIYTSGQIALGFRRLSIIDLNSGHQPMSNEDESIWIAFNGEIYNYQELRVDLLSRGHAFKTKTDTEVIIHLYEELGPGCLNKLRGMFAFALWDEREKVLLLARDRVGIKPLYYCQQGNCLVFASEIKAIVADPGIKPEVAPAMIERFMTFSYMPGEETLFKNIYKLAPGSYLRAKEGKIQIHQYWDLNFSKPSKYPNLRDAEVQLLDLLEETVQQHMISDVPVGVLLSGGVDSTALLSLAVQKGDRDLSSYTVGFSHPGVTDERPYARLAAKTFGSRHYEMSISPQEFADFLPRYIWHMEEPVCEPPAIALYYVSKLASGHVKVLISGEGGDEAFAGYQNYRNLLWLERLKKLTKSWNGSVTVGLSALNGLIHSKKLAKYTPLVGLPLEDYYYSRTSTPFGYFNSSISEFYTDDFRHDQQNAVAAIRRHFTNARDYNVLDKMLYVDTKSWLPDDLLLKADKMTMANSIELRVPFLDHKVLEFAAALPANYKIRGWTTKYLAKRALSGRVPNEILSRPKTGFPVPYESWMRNGLRSWVQDVLLDRRTTNRGYFKKTAIEDLLNKDNTGGGYSKEIFSLLALEQWHRMFLEGEPLSEIA
jgi:asparagine synthase (glutamine-hydrolysing)